MDEQQRIDDPNTAPLSVDELQGRSLGKRIDRINDLLGRVVIALKNASGDEQIPLDVCLPLYEKFARPKNAAVSEEVFRDDVKAWGDLTYGELRDFADEVLAAKKQSDSNLRYSPENTISGIDKAATCGAAGNAGAFTAPLNAEAAKAAAKIAAITSERDGWRDTASQHLRNEEFYRSLIVSVGELFGTEAYTGRDGIIQEEVICIKVEALVRRLQSTSREYAAENAALTGELDAMRAERDKLFAAIKRHHDEKASDRCWRDDDELYGAAGLPPADIRVGDKSAMMANCYRFLEGCCEEGGWRSYAELEAELAASKEECARLKLHGVKHIEWPEMDVPLMAKKIHDSVLDFSQEAKDYRWKRSAEMRIRMKKIVNGAIDLIKSRLRDEGYRIDV